MQCPGCGRDVDPLRAGHVAILEGRFRYFCRTECKGTFLASEEQVETAAPPEVRAVASEPSSVVADKTHAPPHVAQERRVRRAMAAPRAPEPIANAIDAVGIACGVLTPSIGLLGEAAELVQVPLAAVAWVALAARAATQKRDAADAHPLVSLVPAAAAIAAAAWGRAVHDAHATSMAALAGLACAAAIGAERLVAHLGADVRAERERIERALDVRVRALRGEQTVELAASDVSAGETVVVEAGEVVGVDGVVAAGEAHVLPWLDARDQALRREGDAIVAGARVASNRLRLTTTWSGCDRAWVKLSSNTSARIDVAAPTVRAFRLAVERGAPAAAALAAAAAFAANANPPEILATACAGAIAFGAKAASSMVASSFARAQLGALASGVSFKDARAFERAGSANVAVLCARGTVLLGEPDIVAIEPIGAGDLGRVLSLAAGAETGSAHPFAAAILRAARARGVRPDNVRNTTVHAGLGVTGLASSGERLVVGGRPIMLEEKIGVAAADARTTELEAQGRSVLLVALGDKLVGLIALQDGLRSGARAAVQRLLDARIEPVLLSGEARDTCETIGRALDVDHVRPEVLPADRGAEVRALAEGGSVVAVVGHPARDDAALGAADVAIAMGAAGSTPGEWAAALASDDVRDAAVALAIPRATRDRARLTIAMGAGPGLAAFLAIAFGFAPLALAPLAAVLGAALVAIRARED